MMNNRNNFRVLRPQHRWEHEEYQDVEYPCSDERKNARESRRKRNARGYRAAVVFCAGCMGVFLVLFLQSVMMFHWPSVLVSFLLMAVFLSFGVIFDTFAEEEEADELAETQW